MKWDRSKTLAFIISAVICMFATGVLIYVGEGIFSSTRFQWPPNPQTVVSSIFLGLLLGVFFRLLQAKNDNRS